MDASRIRDGDFSFVSEMSTSHGKLVILRRGLDAGWGSVSIAIWLLIFQVHLDHDLIIQCHQTQLRGTTTLDIAVNGTAYYFL